MRYLCSVLLLVTVGCGRSPLLLDEASDGWPGRPPGSAPPSATDQPPPAPPPSPGEPHCAFGLQQADSSPLLVAVVAGQVQFFDRRGEVVASYALKSAPPDAKLAPRASRIETTASHGVVSTRVDWIGGSGPPYVGQHQLLLFESSGQLLWEQTEVTEPFDSQPIWLDSQGGVFRNTADGAQRVAADGTALSLSGLTVFAQPISAGVPVRAEGEYGLWSEGEGFKSLQPPPHPDADPPQVVGDRLVWIALQGGSVLLAGTGTTPTATLPADRLGIQSVSAERWLLLSSINEQSFTRVDLETGAISELSISVPVGLSTLISETDGWHDWPRSPQLAADGGLLQLFRDQQSGRAYRSSDGSNWSPISSSFADVNDVGLSQRAGTLVLTGDQVSLFVPSPLDDETWTSANAAADVESPFTLVERPETSASWLLPEFSPVFLDAAGLCAAGLHRDGGVERLLVFDTETHEEFELTAVEGVGFSVQAVTWIAED